VEQPVRPLDYGHRYVYALPKTISGKIRRVELREMERQKKLGQ
jgi:acyl-coenzyme A synthetase/AMP-(fatty) acid ligase